LTVATFAQAGLAAVGLVVVLSMASTAPLAEGRRETSPFSESNKSDSDGGEIKEFFKGLDFGFGDGEEDDSGGEKGTFLARFEAPELKAYEDLAADRPVMLAIERSSGVGLVAAPELNSYVDRVLRRIVGASPPPTAPPTDRFLSPSACFRTSSQRTNWRRWWRMSSPTSSIVITPAIGSPIARKSRPRS
jgi:hypothetical protein